MVGDGLASFSRSRVVNGILDRVVREREREMCLPMPNKEEEWWRHRCRYL